MPMETRIFPDFKSEAEEAEWWDTHEDESMAAFEQAAAEGRLGRGTTARKAGLPTTTVQSLLTTEPAPPPLRTSQKKGSHHP